MAHDMEQHPLAAAFAALVENGLNGAGEALRILVNEASKLSEPTFDTPQVRGGGFYPSALEKGSRTEQAVNIALC